jgi:uncharacterized membrane protein YdjX (TVP38/TMEM64 family)
MAEQATARPRAGWWRLLLLAALILGALLAHTAGLTSGLTDPAAIRDLLTQSGPWGPAVFIVVFALTHTVGFPSMVLVVVAAAVWPLGSAILISWLGGVAGTSLAYGVAAWAGRDWAMQRIPPRLQRLDQRIAESGVLALLGVRLFLLTPAPADWVCGVASMRYRDFLAATMVGLVPPTIVISTVVSDAVPLVTVASVTVGASLLLAAAAWLAASRSAAVRHRLHLLVAPKRARTAEADPSHS